MVSGNDDNDYSFVRLTADHLIIGRIDILLEDTSGEVGHSAEVHLPAAIIK